MRRLWTAASRHKKKKSSTSEETSCNTQHWMTKARPRTVNLEGEERPLEKEDWHNLLRDLNRPLVSSIHKTGMQSGLRDAGGVGHGHTELAGGKPNICTQCTLGVTSILVTPEYTGIESGFQEKPAESSIYVIRCYNQMIKPNTNTGF